MRLEVKEFYYFYNFFDLVKGFDLCLILLVYKKVGKNTVNGIEFEDENYKNRVKSSVNLSNVRFTEKEVLLGVSDELSSEGYWIYKAKFIKELIHDFDNLILGLEGRD